MTDLNGFWSKAMLACPSCYQSIKTSVQFQTLPVQIKCPGCGHVGAKESFEQQKTKGRPALSETEAKERIATCIKEYESLRGTKKQSKRNTLRGHCKRWPEWFREVAPNLFSELDSATKAKPN